MAQMDTVGPARSAQRVEQARQREARKIARRSFLRVSAFAGLSTDFSPSGATMHATADVAWQGQPCSVMFDVPPLSMVWLGAARP